MPETGLAAPTSHPRGGNTALQSVLLPKERFPTEADASRWLEQHGLKSDVEDSGRHDFGGRFWRARQFDPDPNARHRVIPFGKGGIEATIEATGDEAESAAAAAGERARYEREVDAQLTAAGFAPARAGAAIVPAVAKTAKKRKTTAQLEREHQLTAAVFARLARAEGFSVGEKGSVRAIVPAVAKTAKKRKTTAQLEREHQLTAAVFARLARAEGFSVGEKGSVRAIVPAVAKTAKKRKTTAQLEREQRRETVVGKIQMQYDAHRNVVRSITILSVAVGAVKLNQRCADGFTPLKLEASTVGVLGTGLLFFVARRFGWRRTSSTLVDVGVGMVSGTLASNVGSGKVPMLAQKTGS